MKITFELPDNMSVMSYTLIALDAGATRVFGDILRLEDNLELVICDLKNEHGPYYKRFPTLPTDRNEL